MKLEYNKDYQSVLVDMNKKEILGYGDDSEEIHERFGGERFYLSQTGLSGAGYCHLPIGVFPVCTYNPRTVKSSYWEYGIHRKARRMPYRGIYVCVYIPIGKGYDPLLIDEEDTIVVVQDEYMEQQLVLAIDGRYELFHLFEDLQGIKDFDDVLHLLQEQYYMHEYSIETVAREKGFETFYSNLDYITSRKFVDDRHLELLDERQYLNKNLLAEEKKCYPEFIETFFHVQQWEDECYLLDSFNRNVLRRRLDSDILFAKKEEFEKTFPKIELLKDGDIKVVGKAVGGHVVVAAYTYPEKFIDESTQTLPNYKKLFGYKISHTYYTFEHLEYLLSTEDIIERITNALKYEIKDKENKTVIRYKASKALQVIPDDAKIKIDAEDEKYIYLIDNFMGSFFPDRDWAYAYELKELFDEPLYWMEAREVLAHALDEYEEAEKNEITC